MSEAFLLGHPFLRDLYVNFDLGFFTLPEIATIFVITVGLSYLVSFFSGTYHKIALLGISAVFVILIDPYSALVLFLYSAGSHRLLTTSIDHPLRLRAAAWSLIGAMFLLKAATTYWGSIEAVDFFVLVGLSYYTFRIASMLLDGARVGSYDGSLLDHLIYCFFFPIFVAGPIQRRGQFIRSQRGAIERLELAFVGISAAVILKTFVGDVLFRELAAQCQTRAFELGSPFFVLLTGFFGILGAFCDLQALTMLAIGMGRLCGYEVPKNFNHPFAARSISDFWQRWHMTLTSWAKDYVFMPTLFATRNLNFAILASFLFMGAWHAPTPNWLLWGFGHAVGIIAHRYLKESSFARTVLDELPEMGKVLVARLGWLVTLLYVSIVFVSVSNPEFSEVRQLYAILLL